MKKFISENWFKLMLGPSLLMASFGFMIHSISPANAKGSEATPTNSKYGIVPVNPDGTISVKLSEEQLKAIKPNAIQDVNLVTIKGWEPEMRFFGDSKVGSLGVVVMNN